MSLTSGSESNRLDSIKTCFNTQVTYKEIDEMIRTVDKNGDGKINYSEFRVMMGAHPLLIPPPLLNKSGFHIKFCP